MRSLRSRPDAAGSGGHLPGPQYRASVQEKRPTFDVPNIIGLRLGNEIADLHVFDHAPPQRADALIGHDGRASLALFSSDGSSWCDLA